MNVSTPDLKRYGLVWEYTVSKRPNTYYSRPTIRLYKFYTRKTDVYLVMLDKGKEEVLLGASECPELAFEQAITEWDKWGPDDEYNPLREAYEVFREALRKKGDDT